MWENKASIKGTVKYIKAAYQQKTCWVFSPVFTKGLMLQNCSQAEKLCDFIVSYYS